MTEQPLVLAIDLGTSGPKLAVVDPLGSIRATAFEAVSTQVLPKGGAEQDPREWWRAIDTAAQTVLSKVDRTAVKGVAATGQWAGTVAVGADSQPLRNAIIWMDCRGAEAVEKLAGGPVAGYAPLMALRWLRLTGGAPGLSGKDPLAHILYLREHEPRTFQDTHCFLEPKDYINLRLTGEYRAGYDSIAVHWVTDNRHPGRVKYHKKLLLSCGLEQKQLPELASPTDELAPLRPELRERWGLGGDVRVVMGTPDVHASAIGAGTTAFYEPHVYIGTSAWCSCHVPRKKTDVLHNMAALPAALPDRYLLLNEQETAGACVNHVIQNLLFAPQAASAAGISSASYRAFDELAESSPAGSNGLVFLPWLYGERTPVEDSRLRGAFFNYSLSTRRGDVARAVLEGVALNLRWLYQYVEGFGGRALDNLRFIGGGAQSTLWCQIIADVLDRRILQVKEPKSASLRGVALLAFVSLGVIDVAAIPRSVAIQNEFTPRKEHRGLYRERFEVFLELHRSNKQLFHRLNRHLCP